MSHRWDDTFGGMPLAPGDALGVLDHFSCRNDFYGGQVGLQAQFGPEPFFLAIGGKRP